KGGGMNPKAKLSLLEIEQEVEAQAREWHRQQLQKRLQQVAEEQGAVCPLTGEPLQAACGQLQTRVKRTGQFWKPAGLANMLALKAALQNDDWLALWSRN